MGALTLRKVEAFFQSIFAHNHMDKLCHLALLCALTLCTLGNISAQPAQLSLQGKCICVFGDSYVANHRRPCEETWHYLAAQQLGMEYHNVGRNGSCIAWDRTKEGFGPSMLVRYKLLDPSADIVLIIAGHNDAAFVADSRDSVEMFRDSVSLLIDRVRQQCPQARLAWVTPWHVNRAGFRQVSKAIRKVCKKKGVPVLNNCRTGCVIKVRDPEFRREYFQGANDTAHLNAKGHKLFLPTGLAFLQETLK